MNGFEKRSGMEQRMAETLERLIFRNDGKPFFISPTGIEFVTRNTDGREFLSNLRQMSTSTDPVATSFFYFPDRIIVDTIRRRAFWLEYKSMRQSGRVSLSLVRKRASRRFSGLSQDKWNREIVPNLSVENWGIVERRALDNYRRLSKSLGDKSLLIVVYADFHPDKLIACYESDIVVLYEQDRERFSDSNRANVQRTKGSGTPWANIYLGNFLRLDRFLRRYLGDDKLWNRLNIQKLTEKAIDELRLQ